MGKVQSNTTCNVYSARSFLHSVSTTTGFGLYTDLQHAEHFLIISQKIQYTMFLSLSTSSRAQLYNSRLKDHRNWRIKKYKKIL
jgi:hypothetical protein